MAEHRPPDDHLPEEGVVVALALDVALDLARHTRTGPGQEYPVSDAHDDLLEMASAIRTIGVADRLPTDPAAYFPATCSPTTPTPIAAAVSLRHVVLPPAATPPRRVRRVSRRRQAVMVAVAASAVTLAIGADLALHASGGASPAGAGWAVPAAVHMTLAGDRVALAPTDGGLSSADRVAAVACATTRRCVAIANISGHAVIAVSGDGGTSWQQRPAPGAVAKLSAILCTTPEHCWAVGNDSAGGRDNEAAIVVTNDGGRTWLTEQVPVGVRSLDSITCATPETCWAVGNAGSGNGAAIVTTDDGGQTWSTELVPVGVGSLESITCPTAETCWAGGQAGGSAAVVATTDGGRSWEQEALPVDMSAADTSPQRLTATTGITAVTSITCTTAPTCWATAADGAGTVAVLTGGLEGWHVSGQVSGGRSGVSAYVASPECSTGCSASGEHHTVNTVNAALATIERGTATALRSHAANGAVTCPTVQECWLVRTSGSGFTSTVLDLDSRTGP